VIWPIGPRQLVASKVVTEELIAMTVRRLLVVRLLVLAIFLAIAGAYSLDSASAADGQVSTNGFGWNRN
jgi:hypothetical protein